MNIPIIYLNNFYLYILSFKIKNNTTFMLISVYSIPLKIKKLYYLLINLIIYLINEIFNIGAYFLFEQIKANRIISYIIVFIISAQNIRNKLNSII